MRAHPGSAEYNPPAFPGLRFQLGNRAEGSPGMTLRDWFAGQVINAIVAGEVVSSPLEAAQAAYNIADAMLEVRNR